MPGSSPLQAVDQRRGPIEVAADLSVGGFEAIPVGPCLLHLRLAQQGDQRHEIGRQRGDSVVGHEQGRAIGQALGNGCGRPLPTTSRATYAP